VLACQGDHIRVVAVDQGRGGQRGGGGQVGHADHCSACASAGLSRWL
jgi:hypothetical protein